MINRAPKGNRINRKVWTFIWSGYRSELIAICDHSVIPFVNTLLFEEGLWDEDVIRDPIF